MTSQARESTTLLRRSQRVGTHVRKVDYRGPAAAFAREYLELEAAERRANAMAADADTAAQNALENLLKKACELIDLLIDAAFYADGQHRASRHIWRPWRRTLRLMSTPQDTSKIPGSTASAPVPGMPLAFDPMIELRRCVSCARSHDAGVVPRIRELIVHRPDVWQHVAEQVEEAEYAAVQVLAADDAGRTQLTKELDELRQHHAGERRTPLQQRLLDRAVLHLLQVKLLRRYLEPEPWTKRQQRRIIAVQRREAAAWNHYRQLEARLPRIEPPAVIRLFVANHDDEPASTEPQRG